MMIVPAGVKVHLTLGYTDMKLNTAARMEDAARLASQQCPFNSYSP
jgi:hypothetical protein